MSRSVNKIILVGNAGHDPDIRTTGAGTKVANLKLATSRRIGKNGDYEEQTDWHRLTLWDRLAEIAEDYIQKGDRLYIEGRVEYGSYEKEGVTIPTSDVRVRELVMLGSPRRAAGSEATSEAAEPVVAEA